MTFSWRIALVILALTGFTIITLVLNSASIEHAVPAQIYAVKLEQPLAVTVARPGSSRILAKIHLQNNQVIFNSKQKDKYDEGLSDPVLPLNDRLYEMIKLEEAYQKQQQELLQSRTSPPKPTKHTKPAEPSKPAKAATGSSFRSLDNNSNYFVYSAHHDHVLGGIKIIGFGPLAVDDHPYLLKFKCEVRDNSGSSEYSSFSVFYRISTFYPWEGQTYDSYIFQCNTSLSSPSSITVTSTQNGTVNVTLPIINHRPPTTHQFSVCIEPLLFNYDNTKLIKHFIAANSVFGAEHFYFYVAKTTPKALNFLKSLSTVTVYEWNLGGNLSKRVHASGQKAANAHCLYNHRSTSKYLVYIDLDEVLVPRKYSRWSSLVEHVNSQHSSLGAIVFQSKLFPKNHGSASNDSFIADNRLWSLSHTKTVGVFDLYQWSKVLINTNRTIIVDIHKVRQMVNGSTVVNADPSLAVIHHYRHYDAKSAAGRLVEDNHMSQYADSIIRHYQSISKKESLA